MSNYKPKEIKEEKVNNNTTEEPKKELKKEKENNLSLNFIKELGDTIEFRTFEYNPYRGRLEEIIVKGVISERLLMQNVVNPEWTKCYKVLDRSELINEKDIIDASNKD